MGRNLREYRKEHVRGPHRWHVRLPHKYLCGGRTGQGLYIRLCSVYVNRIYYWYSFVSGGGFKYCHEMSADEIPYERVTPEQLGVRSGPSRAEYTRVAASDYRLFQPSARLTLLVLFSVRTFGEDQKGGWVSLTRSKYERFDLSDRYVRSRAVRAVEREGRMEVRRRQGATTLLRPLRATS
jgi:hypothetical protein